jgi:hypothetical protein
MSVTADTVTFVAYLGDGEFDECTVPVKGEPPFELGDAFDYFEARHKDRSWRMFQKGFEGSEPLARYSPSAKAETVETVETPF